MDTDPTRPKSQPVSIEDNQNELRQVAELIRKALPEKSQADKPLWQGVLDLIEQSEFGTKDAEVTCESPLPPGQTAFGEATSGAFDSVQMKMHEIINSVFRKSGGASLIPYSKGVGTRSMTFVFKAKTK